MREQGNVMILVFNLNYKAIYIAIALLLLRYLLNRFVFMPLGCYFGLRRKSTLQVNRNSFFGKKIDMNTTNENIQIQGLAKPSDCSEKLVEQRIRKRTKYKNPSTLKKFTESAWRFTFHSAAFLCGVYILEKKPWLWNTETYWSYQPNTIMDDVWWHNMIELGYYWSNMYSQFTDTKRKDTVQLFVHHIVAIMLITSVLITDLSIGSLVLILHDFTDIPLEAAKLSAYIRKKLWANTLFAVLVIAWTICRLILYPYKVIYNLMFSSFAHIPHSMAYFLSGLQCTLQILNIIWTWMIAKTGFQLIYSKQFTGKDVRSDNEESESSDYSDENKES